MELVKGNVKVELSCIGEGICGDYNPADPDDVELLRFSVLGRESEKDEWFDIENASYCTALPARADDVTQSKALAFIMDKVYEKVVDGDSVKRICEQLSHINEADFGDDGVESFAELRIEDIRAVEQAATPGPWVRNGRSIYGPKHPASKHHNGRIFLGTIAEGSNRRDPHLSGGHFGERIPGDGTCDAEFIIQAREAIPALLTMLEKVISERDAYKASAEALANADPVITSMDRLVNECGDDGMFKIDGIDISAPDLLLDMKKGGKVGLSFREEVTATILDYFLKFGGKDSE